MNHFAIIRVPHQMPAELLLEYPMRESEEYSSFWDDANSIRSFENDTELARYYIQIDFRTHQWAKIQALIINYFIEDYRGLFCCEPEDNGTNIEQYIRKVSNMTIQERLIQTNQA
jgi:hypothetical protein